MSLLLWIVFAVTLGAVAEIVSRGRRAGLVGVLAATSLWATMTLASCALGLDETPFGVPTRDAAIILIGYACGATASSASPGLMARRRNRGQDLCRTVRACETDAEVFETLSAQGSLDVRSILSLLECLGPGFEMTRRLERAAAADAAARAATSAEGADILVGWWERTCPRGDE